MSENVLDSFFVKLGFKIDNHGLGEFEHKVHGLHHAMEAMGVLAGVELVKRIGEFVERAVAGAAAIQEFSETTGIAAEELDAWRRVAIGAGVDANAMQDSMYGILRATGAAAAGFPRFKKLFDQLGISAKDGTGHVKDSATMMAELADKFKGMDASMRLAVAGRLGIDPRLAALMAKNGAAGMSEMVGGARGQGILTGHDFEQAHETEKAFKRLGSTVSQLTTLVANQLAPAVLKVLDGFQEWWTANRTEVIEKFKKGMHEVGDYVKQLWGYLSGIIGTAKDVYNWFDKLGVSGVILKTVIGGMLAFKLGAWLTSAAAGAMAFARSLTAVNLSTGLIGVLAIAFGLLVEDIYQFTHGGDSLVGRMQEKWSGAFNTVITAVFLLGASLSALLIQATLAAAGISASFSAIMLPLLPLLIGLAGLTIAAMAIKDAWNPLKQWFGELWDSIAEGAKTALEWILKIPGASTIASTLGAFSASGDWDADKWLADRESKHNLDRSKAEGDAWASARFSPDAQGNMVGKVHRNSNTSNVKIDKVEIHADRGREATVGSQLQSQIETANMSSQARNASTPVDY